MTHFLLNFLITDWLVIVHIFLQFHSFSLRHRHAVKCFTLLLSICCMLIFLYYNVFLALIPLLLADYSSKTVQTGLWNFTSTRWTIHWLRFSRGTWIRKQQFRLCFLFFTYIPPNSLDTRIGVHVLFIKNSRFTNRLFCT